MYQSNKLANIFLTKKIILSFLHSTAGSPLGDPAEKGHRVPVIAVSPEGDAAIITKAGYLINPIRKKQLQKRKSVPYF